MRRLLLTPALPLALVACGPGENDPGPGGVTQGEAQALNDAAAMLDANAVSIESLNATERETVR